MEYYLWLFEIGTQIMCFYVSMLSTEYRLYKVVAAKDNDKKNKWIEKLYKKENEFDNIDL